MQTLPDLNAPPPPPGDAPLSTRGLIAVIASISVMAMAATMTFPLISLLLERAEVDGFWIGMNNAAAAIAILLAPLLAPRFLSRFGVAQTLIGCLALAAICFIALKSWENYWWWLVVRFALGAAISGIFVASEYWIITAARPGTRGRIVAIYAMALSGGYALGPLILSFVGVDGWAAYLIATAICLLSAGPLLLAWSDAPRLGGETSEAGALRYFLTDPSLLFAVVLFGLVEFGVMAMIPVWGVKLGMLEAAAIRLTVALALGNFLFQPILGWSADRMPARPLLLSLAVIVLLVAAALPLVAGHLWLLFVVMFVWGGLAAGLYTVSLAAIGERYEGASLAGANAALASAYGLGALAGPPLVGGGMDLLGPHGLSAALAFSAALYCALVLARMAGGRSETRGAA